MLLLKPLPLGAWPQLFEEQTLYRLRHSNGDQSSSFVVLIDIEFKLQHVSLCKSTETSETFTSFLLSI